MIEQASARAATTQDMKQTKPYTLAIESGAKAHRLALVRDMGCIFETGRTQITCPEHLAEFLYEQYYFDKPAEHLMAVMLNNQNVIIGFHILSTGSADASIVSPSHLFASAMLANATQIILVHNHPSGNPEPSRQDIDTASRLQQVGQLIGIEVLDSIIIAYGGRYTSMMESGFMECRRL